MADPLQNGPFKCCTIVIVAVWMVLHLPCPINAEKPKVALSVLSITKKSSFGELEDRLILSKSVHGKVAQPEIDFHHRHVLEAQKMHEPDQVASNTVKPMGNTAEQHQDTNTDHHEAKNQLNTPQKQGHIEQVGCAYVLLISQSSAKRNALLFFRLYSPIMGCIRP